MKPPSSEDIFLDALELPPDERDAFLRSRCADNAALIAEVRSLLAANESAGAFLETPVVAASQALNNQTDPSIGKTVGAFKLRECIGQGGMGRVYLADRIDQEFDQQVAIKLIRQGAYDDESLRRFRNECRVLASLEHPNIARMIDGGVTGAGLPYIVMEYVNGTPIDKFCNARDLNLAGRLDLFRTVCDAVSHSHRHSTIHRDIKPSNILVDENGIVKLVDFGIARVVDAAEVRDEERTETSQQMLTPLYASPEQLRGEHLSTATDVYSLGVVLYKLLTDRVPFTVETGSLPEMLEILSDTSPTKPSDAMLRPSGKEERSNTTSEATRKRIRELKGDLDTIIMMSLRLEPERRYASVEHFSEDIHRYLRGLPVTAQPDTFNYRATKFVRRNRVAVLASAIVLAVIVGSAIMGFTLYRNAEISRREAVIARDEAERNLETTQQVSQFVTGMFEEASPENAKGASLTAREIVDLGRARIDSELKDQPAVRASVLMTIGEVYVSLGLPDSARSLLEEAIAIERNRKVGVHRDLARSLRAYGDLLDNVGEYDKALEIHNRALAAMEELFGEDAPEIAPYLNRIAISNPQMSFEDKIALFRRSLAIMEKHHGPDHPQVAHYLINLAGAMRRSGSFEEGYQLLLRSLEIRERHLDPNDAYIAQSLASIGAVLNQMKRYSEALPYYIRSNAIREEIYGPGHPQLTPSLNGLASSYHYLGQYEKAIPLFERCLTINTNAYGPDHPWIGHDNAGLGATLALAGRTEEARKHFQRGLEIFTDSYGEGHYLTAIPLKGLGELCASDGDHRTAVRYLEQALEIREEAFGKNHSLLAEILEPLAVSLRTIGEESRAVALETRADSIQVR